VKLREKPEQWATGPFLRQLISPVGLESSNSLYARQAFSSGVKCQQTLFDRQGMEFG
jgi:hypothetical protein